MPHNSMWRRYLRFFGSDTAADVEDELRFHIQSKMDELVDQGWPPESARVEAERQFGNFRAVQKTCEAAAQKQEEKMKSTEYLSACYGDIRFGVRQLQQHAGATFFSILTLGMGMGAVTAVFSIVYAVLLHPLPFPTPENLVTLWSMREGVDDVVTPRNFDVWRHESQSFSHLGALQATTFTLSQSSHAVQVPGAFVSNDFFQVFGMPAELGRTFTFEEDQPPRLHLAVLSHQLWQNYFGGDPQVLGSQIRLNREPYVVIGVMPAKFSVRPDSEQVWVPLALSGQEMTWSGGILNVFGRLKSPVTRQEAQAEMNVMARRLQTRYPDMNRGRGIRVGDYAADLVGNYRERLLLLLGSVGFVLLISCANVANLLLARSTGRRQELSIRAALGASRARIVRQLLTENFLVALGGATLGLGLAVAVIRFVRTLSGTSIPRLSEASIQGSALPFMFGLALASTLLSGLVPAIRSAQGDIQTALRQGGRNAGLARDRTRSAYIAFEVALALVLLVGAGLLIRTAIAAEHVQPGFAPQHLISGRTALPPGNYRNAEQIIQAYRRILEALHSQPEVKSTALSSKTPLSHNTVGLQLKTNSVTPPLKQEFAAELRYISAGYLETMKIPLQSGREFTAHDQPGSAQVVLVSDILARRLWPVGSALGQSIRLPELDGRSNQWQVVGVVANVRDNGVMSEPPPVIYVPFTQVSTNPWHWIEQSLYLVARTSGNATNSSDLLRRALREADSELPLGDVRTMEERLAGSVSAARFYTLALSVLGVCGLALTTIGIYGVVAYFVSRQRAEIGVRLALGSTGPGVILLVVRQGMRPVLAGITLGLLLSVALTRFLAAQLYGVRANDPTTLLAVTALLTGVAALACYLPAREAAQVDPMVTLRSQ